MSKHKKDAKIFSLRIFDVFPKDDPIAIDILRLMFGCNDTYLIEEWANGTKAIPANTGAQVIAAGRNTLQLRLLCSFLSVWLEVLDGLIKRPGFEALCTLISSEGQLALSKLSKIQLKKVAPSARGWGVNETMLRARHTATAHYDFEKARDALLKWRSNHGPTEAGPVVFRQGLGGSDPFYGIADMAIAEMSFELGNPNFWENVDGILELIHALRVFVDSLFWAFIKDRNLHDFIRVDREMNKDNQ